MYEKFFGLKERPFSISPDPRFICLTPQHQEAIGRAQYAITQRMGLMAVFGQVGLGKTSIARRLLQQFSDDPPYNLAILVHPNFPSPFQFIRQIRREFGDDQPRRSLSDELSQFQHFLIREHREGKTTVLFVDEAQTLRPPLFEVLRQLLNYETATQKLLQIVLFGQMELATKIDRIPELKDRVTIFASLSSLSRKETEELIDFRWRVAGGSDHPFADDALGEIFRYSNGRPRRLCKLCDNALLLAFSRQIAEIDGRVIRQVAEEMRMTALSPTPESSDRTAEPEPVAA